MKQLKSWKLTLGLVCVALLVSACTSSPQTMILGKWDVDTARDADGRVQTFNGQVGGKSMSVEFDNNGTAKLTMMGQTMRGTYQLNAGNELTWTVNGMSVKSKAKITATELELTDQANRTIRYKRK
jgi:hypothetical protein